MSARPDSRVVFYALDDSSLHVYFASHSIATLRRHNTSIGVRVVLFAPEPPPEFASHLAEHDVELVVRSADGDGLNPWFFKWLALASVPEDRALFVDADTAFFDDPDLLFDRRDQRDFYAREEVGARADAGVHFSGGQLVRPKVDVESCAHLCAKLELEELLFFNTGVMLFNHGAAGRLGPKVDQLRTLRRRLIQGELPFPWTVHHAADCVVGSIFIATQALTTGFLGPVVAPFYTELRSGVATGPGVVLHTFEALYPFYVAEFLGAEALRDYPGPRNFSLEFEPR